MVPDDVPDVKHSVHTRLCRLHDSPVRVALVRPPAGGAKRQSSQLRPAGAAGIRPRRPAPGAPTPTHPPTCPHGLWPGLGLGLGLGLQVVQTGSHGGEALLCCARLTDWDPCPCHCVT